MEGTMATIIPFAGNFAPRTFALCQGQLLPISSNTALFSLIGTYYGGDGRTTFALPDLQGRTMVQQGRGAGLSQVNLGQKGGVEQRSLSISNLPAHGHTASTTLSNLTATLHAEEGAGDKPSPQGNMLAGLVGTNKLYKAFNAADNKTLAPEAVTIGGNASTTIGNTGSGIPFDNRGPFLGVNLCICLQGVFPSRN